MDRSESPKRRLVSLEPTDATTPAELLEEIAQKTRAAADDHDRLIDIGAGVLESMFHQGYADEVWPEMVRLAESEPPFRTALGAVWAKHPGLQPLLWRLGYWRRFTLTAVLYDSPGAPLGLGIRAPRVEGFDRSQLPGLLRQLADAIEEHPRWVKPGLGHEDGEVQLDGEG
ncbi:MAG: hypothetical protein U0P45_09060 [Acidimicrobiales bacterium]